MTLRQETQSRWSGRPRWVRVSAYLAVLVVLALVAGTAAAVVAVRRPFPQTTGTIEVAGPGAPIEVWRDDAGVPQVYADTTADLFFAQGFVQAQDRFYEMDVRRHITAGRLAEMFGAEALDTDRVVRVMGWRRIAEQEVSELNSEATEALESFSAGVNAYLADKAPGRVSVEYTVLSLGGLDYDIEPWTPADSVAWLKAMAWDLRGNMADEIDRTLLSRRLDGAEVAELYPPYPYEEHPTILTGGGLVEGRYRPDAGRSDSVARVPPGPAVAAALRATSSAAAHLPRMVGSGEGIGSNSWVVDGTRTTTGAPILANDPHLAPTLPGVWYQMGLHCRTVGPSCPYDVAGFTFAGFPGVIIGHNQRVAWGFTNLGPDVTDLFLERVQGDFYRRGRELVPFEVRSETIEVAGAEPEQVRIRTSVHGPVLSDVGDSYRRLGRRAFGLPGIPRRKRGYAVSLSWTALSPNRTAESVFALNRAGDFTDFREALRTFAVPSQNVVYADVEGNIGYQAPGLIPIRNEANLGDYPSPGWQTRYDWTGEYVDFEELPWTLNPPSSVIVTANQPPAEASYPVFGSEDFDLGYRARRITELIGTDTRLSMEDMQSIQLDAVDPLAPLLVPRLLEVEVGNGYYREGQDLLRGWDFSTDAGSGAAAYYNATWRELLALTFEDQVPPAVAISGGSRWMRVVAELLQSPDSRWWDDVDTEMVETRDDILIAAQRAARDALVAAQSRQVSDWDWGHQHSLELRNQTLGGSDLGPVRALVNRGGWELGGGSSILNATGWDAEEGFEVSWVPSMRMVVSLADLDDSTWVNLTGASGHAFSPHYTDQTDVWTQGRTRSWPFTVEAVREQTEDRLVLIAPTS